jgi:hypothetical protein
MIINKDIHTNYIYRYIYRLINECTFDLKRTELNMSTIERYRSGAGFPSMTPSTNCSLSRRRQHYSHIAMTVMREHHHHVSHLDEASKGVMVSMSYTK